MKSFGIIRESARTLRAHKLRSFFMMAGVIAGIASLVVVTAIGKGTEKKVMKRVNSFGPRAMMLMAGGGKDLPPPDMTVTTLTLDDADAVREQIDDLEIVSPMAWRFRMNLKREANQIQAVVWGVEPNWHDAWNWFIANGEGISDQDVATMARVCVIGQTVKQELFGNDNPVGSRIYVNNVRLTVKGVLEKKGASPMGHDFDNRIILPITTAMRRIMNVDYVGAIRIITRNPSLMRKQAEAIRRLIHERHHITPPEEDDFRVVTSIIIAKIARGVYGTLSKLLIVLTVLSLFVGGMVLMNILLISVNERTKEIGIRRALGATRRDIFIQFLAESLAVTFLGMLMGSAVGWGIGCLLAHFTKVPIVLSWVPFVLSTVFALVLGVCFGVLPARRAARLNPVEALR